jgi:predicted ATPase
MRISSVEVTEWRNMRDVSFDVPQDANLICLIGENGTGKSNVLELLASVASRFGLSTGVNLRRGDPLGEPHDVKVTLQLPEDFELPSQQVEQLAQDGVHLDPWDRTICLRSQNLQPHQGVPAMPFGPGSPEAGGFENSQHRVLVGNAIVSALAQQDEVNHFFVDAERAFPRLSLQDQEIWNLAKQDLKVPSLIRQQAGTLTQNMYSEWLKWLLAQSIRGEQDYMALALNAKREGNPIPEPEDDLDPFRQSVAKVLPHLVVDRLDRASQTLVFNSAGKDLAYEALSGGEREIAFLVGQIERFQLRRGLLLLDEPELHLNPELLRTWLAYVRSSMDDGQVWIATHALEAVEIAGLDASMVFERSDDRLVRTVGPLGDRPALTVLAGALGSPAFSLATARFVLVEGERLGRERERIAQIIDADTSTRFLEAGGCREVLRKVETLKELSEETDDQLRVGAIIDRDLRTDAQVALLEAQGVHVLPCHEIESFFLHPAAIEKLIEQEGGDPETGAGVVRSESDRHAGRWIYERAKVANDWDDEPPVRRSASEKSWGDFESDIDAAASTIAEAGGGSQAEKLRRKAGLRAAAQDYQRMRTDGNELWKRCFGKQVLNGIASPLGLKTGEAVEKRVQRLWDSGEIARPAEVETTKAYIEAIEVL